MNRYSSVGGDSDPRFLHFFCSEGIPIPDSYISSVGGDSDPRSYILFSMQSVHSAIRGKRQAINQSFFPNCKLLNLWNNHK